MSVGRDPALLRALRRGAPAVALGVLCLLAAIPAMFDLRRLFVGVGLVLVVIGALATVLTWQEQRSRS